MRICITTRTRRVRFPIRRESVVLAGSILGHLRAKRHRSHTDAQPALTDAQRIAFTEEAWKPDPFNPLTASFQPPPPQTRPIPGLTVYDGYGCPECDMYMG